MIVVSSSYRIINIEMPRQGVNNIAHAGFRNISLDFSIGYAPGELEYNRINSDPNFDKAISLCEQNGLNISISRAPFLMPNTKRTDLNETLCNITEKCIDFCGRIGCEYIVVPPLFASVPKDKHWQINHEYYIRLGKIATQKNVMILLENQILNFNGHLVRGICSDAYDASKWIDDLNTEIGCECFGFCLDVGVCSICGQNMLDFAVVLGKRIKAVVLRDGISDDRQLPFTCTYKGQAQVDWLSLIRGLREIEFDGQLIVDYGDSVVAFPTLLRSHIFESAKDVGNYFKWQIELENILKKHEKRVLFGAGNMCRNYMKCYGRQYPPLFTCDNNSALWGTVFEGLEVKSPDALKDIPQGCAIYICNIYYDEIKEQLLNMGINNPIEYFNDEYMPSFYFDRLDAEKRTLR